MKRKIGLLLLCLLAGCTATPKEEPVSEVEPNETDAMVTREIYTHPLTGNALDACENYPLRLAAVQNGEYEQVIIVREKSGGEGEEITVRDETELAKIKTYFQSVSLTGERASIGPQTFIGDFAITLKGKEPIYLRIYDEALAYADTRYLINSAQPLYEMIDGLKGEVREVYAPDIIAPFVDNLVWTDVLPVEVPLGETVNNNSALASDLIVLDSFGTSDDPLLNTLKIANYIHEEFQSWQEIEDKERLTAGIVQQSQGYDCSITDYINENVCIASKSNDKLYLPNGKPKLTRYIYGVYNLIPVQTVLEKGRQLFGEDYQLPTLETGEFAKGNLQFYDWLEEEQLFAYRMIGEVMMRPVNGMFILSRQEIGDEVSVIMMRFKEEPRYDKNIEDFKKMVYGRDGYVIEMATDVDADTFEERMISEKNNFEQWKYTLKKTTDGYEIIEARRYNQYDFIPELQEGKAEVYRDDANDVQINLATADAGHFNRWVKAQHLMPTTSTYKENIHQNLLSVWVKGETSFAVVFDLATGKALSAEEVMAKLQINQAKLLKSIQEVEGFSHVTEEYLEWNNPIMDFKTTNIFIDSKGNPALYLNRQLLLFSWEEVR